MTAAPAGRTARRAAVDAAVTGRGGSRWATPPLMVTTSSASSMRAVELVGAEDHGGAGGGGVADQLVDEVAAVLVEPGVGLVEQPQLGAAGDQAGQRGAAALTGGEAADGDVPQATVEARGAPWRRRRRPGRPGRPGPRSARCRRR